MEKYYGLWRGIVLISWFLLLPPLSGCQYKPADELVFEEDLVKEVPQEVSKKTNAVNFDLKEIKQRGKLVALTGYSYTSYFIYKGSPMGYEYELLDLLAKHLGVKLEIVVVKNMDEIFEKLNKGEGDIIADNLPVTKEWEEKVDFTVPCNITRQVLVQRLPDNWKRMSHREREKAIIRNPLDLIGKPVHVRKESAFYHRLKNLSAEIGEDIEIVEVSGETETEELLQKVSIGEIDYTIADEKMAMFQKTWHRNLDIETAISFPQRVAWAVRETSPDLLNEVNKWILKMKRNPTWYAIHNKYYKSSKTIGEMVNCSRIATCKDKISPYDDLIINEAKKINWDWRLLTSVIYQESRFNPSARSWAGATGLMQLMPRTAESFGVTDLENPNESLKGGVKYLGWLENYWKKKVPDPKERIKFILGSYNVGQEHVADAQRLAKKYGKDPLKWEDNVAHFLVLKSKEKYCNDPVVKFGYCRGQEPVNYVEDILYRYEHYKKLIKQDIYLTAVR